MFSSEEIRQFIDGYLECALWTSFDETPLDAEYDVRDFEANSCERAAYECMEFFAANEVDLTWYSQSIEISQDAQSAWDMAGHDFWLTRNSHGAGYWDREAGQAGESLSTAARAYGEISVWPASDHKLEIS